MKERRCEPHFFFVSASLTSQNEFFLPAVQTEQEAHLRFALFEQMYLFSQTANEGRHYLLSPAQTVCFCVWYNSDTDLTRNSTLSSSSYLYSHAGFHLWDNQALLLKLKHFKIEQRGLASGCATGSKCVFAKICILYLFTSVLASLRF